MCGGKSALKASFRKSTSREATPRAGGVRTRPLQNGADDVRFSAQNAHLRAILPNFASRLVRDASKPARFFLRAAAKQRVIHHHPLAAESIHFASKTEPRARLSRRDARFRDGSTSFASFFFARKKNKNKKRRDTRRLVVRTSSSSSSSSFSSLWGTGQAVRKVRKEYLFFVLFVESSQLNSRSEPSASFFWSLFSLFFLSVVFSVFFFDLFFIHRVSIRPSSLFFLLFFLLFFVFLSVF